MSCGWATTHHSPYDQRYYRTWMHELPPLRHAVRGSILHFLDDPGPAVAEAAGALAPGGGDATDAQEIEARMAIHLGDVIVDGFLSIDVDETTPMGRAQVTSLDPLVISAESGAFEDVKRPRQLSPGGTADVILSSDDDEQQEQEDEGDDDREDGEDRARLVTLEVVEEEREELHAAFSTRPSSMCRRRDAR